MLLRIHTDFRQEQHQHHIVSIKTDVELKIKHSPNISLKEFLLNINNFFFIKWGKHKNDSNENEN